MRLTGAEWKKAATFVFTLVLAFAGLCAAFYGSTYFCARNFEEAVSTECGIEKEPRPGSSPVCLELKRPVPRVTSDFFAIQTITTTGYGSDPALRLERVQALANRIMPLGALLWGLGIAFIYDILKASEKKEARTSS